MSPNRPQNALWAGVRFGLMLGALIGFFHANRIKRLVDKSLPTPNSMSNRIDAGKRAVRQQQSVLN